MNSKQNEAVIKLAEETIKASLKYLTSALKKSYEIENNINTIISSADSDTTKIKKINELLNSKKNE